MLTCQLVMPTSTNNLLNYHRLLKITRYVRIKWIRIPGLYSKRFPKIVLTFIKKKGCNAAYYVSIFEWAGFRVIFCSVFIIKLNHYHHQTSVDDQAWWWRSGFILRIGFVLNNMTLTLEHTHSTHSSHRLDIFRYSMYPFHILWWRVLTVYNMWNMKRVKLPRWAATIKQAVSADLWTISVSLFTYGIMQTEWAIHLLQLLPNSSWPFLIIFKDIDKGEGNNIY